MFEALGAFVFRFRWLVLVGSGAFVGAALLVLLRGGQLTGGEIHGLEVDRAQAIVDRVAGHPADTTLVVVFQGVHDERLDAHDPRFAAAMEGALAPLRDAFVHDLDGTLERDLARAEIVSMPLALIVLLLVFRTVVAAALPVGVGGLAEVGGVALVLALSRHVDIAQFTVDVCSLIGTGVAIDYSLFMVSRYREELTAGRERREALVRTMGTAGRVVGFPAMAVATGLAGLL